jgi:hypothetical protein
MFHVMQHPRALDEVEALLHSSKREDVRLPVFDVLHAQFARLALGIAEARQAEVHGEHARAGEAPRGDNGMLSCAASRDENSRVLRNFP